MLINFIIAIVQCVRAPSWATGWWIVVSLALLVLALLTRLNPLTAQDRIIRLEERLRYHQLLPEEVAREASTTLTRGQVIALRFAPDEELPALVRQVLDGKLTRPAEIKRAIQAWRADDFRI